MPRVKDVPSLTTQCVTCVRTHILKSDFYVKLSANESADMRIPQLESNPFHELPTHLLLKIITSLTRTIVGEKTKTPAAVLEHLVTPQFALTPFIVKSEKYLTFFTKFGCLQVLKLQSSGVGDECLRVIGNCCKQLCVLDLDTCRNVTDAGIQWLCFNSSNENSELCKTLFQLFIYQTSVTKKGAQMAFKNLTALKILDHDNIFEILVELGQVALDNNVSEVQTFPFTSLLIANISPYVSGRFGLALSLCPLLISISIIAMKGLRDADLLSLIVFKKLNRLNILGHPNAKEVEITFLGGVAPILKETGSFLEFLDLSFFKTVDIWTVIKYCPNLISLSFNNHCESNSVLSKEEINYFLKEKQRFVLKKLRILECAYRIHPDILHFLLSFPLLENIYFYDCKTLTDAFLIDAVSYHNSFQNVKELKLEHCKLITTQGIDALMTEHNALERISFYSCNNLSLKDFYGWCMLARKKNWRLTLCYKTSDSEALYYHS